MDTGLLSTGAPRVLVAALGSTLRGDDGFGPRLLARVGRSLPPFVRTRDFGTHGVALVQALFDGVDVLIVLDACRRGGRPGSVYVMRPSIPGTLNEGSGVHLTGLGAALSLARELGVLPPAVWLIGCEPGDVTHYRLGLTRAVRGAMRRAARAVEEVVAASLAPHEGTTARQERAR